MKNKNTMTIRKLVILSLGLVVAICFFYSFVNTTYASRASQSPDVTITINKNGQVSCTGNLFGEDLWYPGYSKSGVIRISNDFKSIKVENLGLTVNLNEFNNTYNRETVYNSFLNNMKLKIEKGKLFSFGDVIIDEISFSELLYQPDSQDRQGKNLNENQFTIGKNDSVDLKYTLLMVEESGDDLQNVSADVGFIINAEDQVPKP